MMRKRWLCVVLAAALAAILLVGRAHTDFAAVETSKIAMGTVVTQRIFGGSDADADAVTAAITALDAEISRYIETSAVAELNRSGHADSAVLAELIRTCNAVSAASGGAFDITVGKLTRLWDFDNGGSLPQASDIQAALGGIGAARLTVDGDAVTAASGTAVDLGAVGKGAACDAARAVLEARGVPGAIVSVGGSVLAYGSRNAAGDKWRIAVRHPRNADATLGVIELTSGCVSTSGDYEKYFEADGVRYHHLLDPATGYPAESGLVSVTVVCESGLLSDALSTACFVLGAEKSLPLLDAYGAGAIFVFGDLRVKVVGDVEFTVQ